MLSFFCALLLAACSGDLDLPPEMAAPGGAASVQDKANPGWGSSLGNALIPPVSAAPGSAGSSAVKSKNGGVGDYDWALPAGSPTMPARMDSSNTLLVTNPTNAAISDYPLQFGRPFRQGEVAQCPKLYYKGVELPAQFDVKNRWDDGSLRFAVVSVVLPGIDAGQRATIELKGQAVCESGKGLATAQMLDGFDFDATVALNGGVAGVASAREMLAAGAYWRWADGPVNTTAIIEDHTGKRFDFGTDSHRSLRPIFHVQFWPQAKAYRVRVVVEQSDTTKLQNQDYSVQVQVGHAKPQLAYAKAEVGHIYASRWTRDFWVGRELPELSVQHNIGYLASTRALPNFDPSITLAQTAKAALLKSWEGKGKDIYDAGLWQKGMPTAGGRPDIGLVPSWHVFALYDGDAELWKLVRRQTDLAATWPAHFRTGDSRVFDERSGAAGLGRPATRDSHPTQFLRDRNGYMNSNNGVRQDDYFGYLGDLAKIGSTETMKGWIIDGAHQPDPWYPTYLVTGEWWYLEQLQFWASWGLFASNPGRECWASGRSPKDAVIKSETRGDAWLLRTRARAGMASPDGSPERAYYSRATEQVLRAWEGQRIGSGTDPIRAYWAQNRCPVPSANPLHYWEYSGGGPYKATGIADVAAGTAPWMYGFVIAALGHAGELGFDTSELVGWTATFLTGIVAAPGSDPRHLADYWVPLEKNVAGNPLFQSWEDAFDNWHDWTDGWARSAKSSDLHHNYASIMTTAVSYIRNQNNGQTAWDWVYRNNYAVQRWDQNPKWAILPRD